MVTLQKTAGGNKPFQRFKYTTSRINTCVFVIDIQEKLLPIVPEAETVLKNTSVLLEAAKAYQLKAVYSEQYPKGLGKTVSPLREALEELAAFQLEKTSYNALLPEMLAELKERDCKQIIITGIETHICVLQTVRSLLEKGFTVFIPHDAVGSRDPENKHVALELLRDAGATITSTETILFDLMGDSKDPHFKELQALIK